MTVMDYRTRDGLADYGFSIESQSDEGWRVYINFQPLWSGGKAPDLPYQSIDNKGRRFVDWPGRLDNLSEAKIVAGLWAELVESYRRGQEQKALYIQLIERHMQTQRRALLVRQDHAAMASTRADEPRQQGNCGSGAHAAARESP